MKQQKETRYAVSSRMCTNSGYLTAKREIGGADRSKNAEITDFVQRAFIIFNYKGQAAKELLEVFKENLVKTGDWYPVDIEITEARFLNFQVGPMAFFYQDLPCQPESLIMLPAKPGILERSYEWFARNLNNYTSRETRTGLQKETPFRIKKQSIANPGKKIVVNYRS
ncbi:MAG: hypothetical protein ACFFD4_23605 [Candidatus Odinarchaeota archaeon]